MEIRKYITYEISIKYLFIYLFILGFDKGQRYSICWCSSLLPR